NGISPWSGEVFNDEYIKREARAGRMGQQLIAVAIKNELGRDFREARDADRAAEAAAATEPERCRHDLVAKDVIPSEPVAESSSDPRPVLYGMPLWSDLFSARQL